MSTPFAFALACFGIGAVLIVGAIFILAGIGWALLAAAFPFVILGGVIVRGLHGRSN